jgi:hypothetical protein
MSWHTNGILIHSEFGKDPQRVLAALDVEADEFGSSISFDEAASSTHDGIAVGFIDGWTLIFGGIAMFEISSDKLAEISSDCAVFEMMLEGSSGTAGFNWYTGGEKVREYLSQAGEIIKDEGTQLAAEGEGFAEDDAEQAVLDLMTHLTLPFARINACQFTLFDLD